jgi:hypothetical protein
MDTNIFRYFINHTYTIAVAQIRIRLLTEFFTTLSYITDDLPRIKKEQQLFQKFQVGAEDVAFIQGFTDYYFNELKLNVSDWSSKSFHSSLDECPVMPIYVGSPVSHINTKSIASWIRKEISPSLFISWKIDRMYEAGCAFSYNGKLYVHSFEAQYTKNLPYFQQFIAACIQENPYASKTN